MNSLHIGGMRLLLLALEEEILLFALTCVEAFAFCFPSSPPESSPGEELLIIWRQRPS